MSAEYGQAIDSYLATWHELTAMQEDSLLADLRPTAIGWKVADANEFDERYAALLGGSEQVYVERLNDRLIAKMLLGKQAALRGVRIVKIMQRRPGSPDATGLDHVDFYCPDMKLAETVLGQSDLRWTHESNGPNHPWISIWFGGTQAQPMEAKLMDHTVLEVASKNLHDANRDVAHGR